VAGDADRPGRRTAARLAAAATAAGTPPVAVHTVHGSAAMLPHEAPEALAAVIADAMASAPAMERGVTPVAPRTGAM
jgi:hypothetical protein